MAPAQSEFIPPKMKPALAPTQGLDKTVSQNRAPKATVTANRTYARSAVFPASDGAAPTEERPRYEDLGALGQGGMGEVLLVDDHDIHRKVAIKRLLGGGESAEAVLRFAEEVRTIGQLEHPSIPPIHDVGTDEDGRHYFTMKYVQGETLEAVIAKISEGDPGYLARFTLERRISLFKQILNAVAFAHAKGVIHRDLKPSNVMIGPFGEVTVMDWGLAKKIHEAKSTPTALAAAPLQLTPIGGPPAPEKRFLATMQGAILGTPAYMSPEQARGENETLDERSDVYSLGVILLELLSGQHYLKDKQSLEDLIDGILTFDDAKVIPMLTEGRVGMIFHPVIENAMAKDPAERYDSVEQLSEVIDSISRGDMDVVCPFTLNRRMTFAWMRWVESHPTAYMTTFGLAIAALVGGLGTGVYEVIHHLG